MILLLNFLLLILLVAGKIEQNYAPHQKVDNKANSPKLVRNRRQESPDWKPPISPDWKPPIKPNEPVWVPQPIRPKCPKHFCGLALSYDQELDCVLDCSPDWQAPIGPKCPKEYCDMALNYEQELDCVLDCGPNWKPPIQPNEPVWVPQPIQPPIQPPIREPVGPGWR